MKKRTCEKKMQQIKKMRCPLTVINEVEVQPKTLPAHIL